MQEYGLNRSAPVQNTKVTVIIPVYNAEKYLDECLKSVLSQSLSAIEVICVDDGSADDSRAILYSYAVKDSRLRVCVQKNAGAASARNIGIAEAQGQYIAFMDADDFYPSRDVLEKLYTAAEVNGALVCGGCFSSLEGGKIITEYPPDLFGYVFRKSGFMRFADYQFDYGFHRFLYRTDFLRAKKLLFPDYARFQDPPFLAQTLSAAETFYALKDVTYVYRVGHKAVQWNEKKVLGLIRGIRDNLQLSADRGYAKLYALNWNRLNSKYYTKIILSQAQKPGNGQIAKELAALQSCANAALLGEQSGRAPLNRPLQSLLDGWIAQDKKLYDEGWFIHRRIFRLYTWPLRAFGRMCRRRRERKSK